MQQIAAAIGLGLFAFLALRTTLQFAIGHAVAYARRRHK